MASSGDSGAWAVSPETAVSPPRDRGGQVAFEIEFLERLLASSPDHLDALRRFAELLSRHGRVDEALAIDRRLVALRPQDCVARYNLACTLARGRRADEALTELGRAIDAGYDDLAFLELDRDLESLRDEPAYQALLLELRRQVAARNSRN
jgi:predicted Zn-dependent protease